ncbi:hypothetical protein Tsubulata_006455, partial [Turnera subulata]
MAYGQHQKEAQPTLVQHQQDLPRTNVAIVMQSCGMKKETVKAKGRGTLNSPYNIRAYNSTFAFTSMGSIIDREINSKRGSYVFRLNGQNHHLIGSLLPMPRQQPRFAQLYVYNTDNEVQNRNQIMGSSLGERRLYETFLNDLMSMLDEHNVLVQSFRVARERYAQDDVGEFWLRIVNSREKDGRKYNTPTSSDITMLIVGDLDENAINRDSVVEHRQKGLQRITELHPSFMSMQYPLLFPYGEDGYRLGIEHRGDNQTLPNKRTTLTMREYYAFRIQIRENEGRIIVLAEKLKDQYISYIRACTMQSHTETRTLYCLEREQSCRPCIQAIHDTKFKTIKMQWQYIVLYTIEFQQRGLPHAHILVFLQRNDKNPSPAKIDRIISVEIPDRQEDELRYQAVQNFKIHGPCGVLNLRSPCMHDHRCTKNYPKRYYEETTVDEQGFQVYCRRRNNNTIVRNGIEVSNQFIVSYSRDLIVKYQPHINVEVCNHARSIKNLFKYIHKGPDRA